MFTAGGSQGMSQPIHFASAPRCVTGHSLSIIQSIADHIQASRHHDEESASLGNSDVSQSQLRVIEEGAELVKELPVVD